MEVAWFLNLAKSESNSGFSRGAGSESRGNALLLMRSGPWPLVGFGQIGNRRNHSVAQELVSSLLPRTVYYFTFEADFHCINDELVCRDVVDAMRGIVGTCL